VAYAADGKTLASAGADATVRLSDAAGKELATLKGHARSVECLAFSPDGRLLASGCRGVVGVAPGKDKPGKPAQPGEIKLWEVGRAEAVHTIPRTGDSELDLAFDPEGRTLVYTDRDNLHAWDVAAKKEGPPINSPASGVFRFAYSPDGRRLACLAHSGSGPTLISILDAKTGKELVSYHGLEYESGPVAFSPDGRFVLAFHHGLQLRDLRGGPGFLRLAGHRGDVRQLVFSRDGRRLFTGGSDGLVKVWDTATGLELRTIPAHPSGVSGLAVSPDGKTLVTCAEMNFARAGSLKVWEAETGKLVREEKNASMGVGAVAITLDGKLLVSGAGNVDKGEITVWELQTGNRLTSWPAHKGMVTTISLSPDGERLATLALMEPEAKVWHIREGKELGSLRTLGPPLGVAYAPNGRFLATGSSPSIIDRRGEIKVWDLLTRREFRILRGHNNAVQSVAFTPDGQRLASGSIDGTIRVWDVLNGQEVLSLPGNPYGVGSVVFSPGGQLLASGGTNGDVLLWNGIRSREEVVVRAGGQWTAVSADGQLLASRDEDGTLRFWDGRTLRPGLTVRPDGRTVRTTAFHLDTGLLALNGGKSVRVVDVRTGKEVAALPDLDPPAALLHFSEDGQRLATVGAEFDAERKLTGVAVTVWEIASGKQLYGRKGPAEWAQELTVSPDLTRLSHETRERRYRVVDLTTGKAIPGAPALLRRPLDVAYKPEGRELIVEKTAVGFDDRWRVLHAKDSEYDRGFRAGLTQFDRAWHRAEADASAQAGHWFAAAHHLHRLASHQPAEAVGVSTQLWYDYCSAARARGDLSSYKAVCADLLKRFGDTRDPEVANPLAWMCAMMPGAVEDPARPLRLAEMAVASNPRNSSWVGTLGLVLYRCGKYDEAKTRLDEAVKLAGNNGAPEDRFVLAMAHARLKDPLKAQEWLKEGIVLVEARAKEKDLYFRKFPPFTWQAGLEWRWLREEAEAELKGATP
jgi:WD40 repeat protein